MIREATLSDAQALYQIYWPYVEYTAISFETTMPTVAAFTERMALTMTRYPYLVLQDADGLIVGYAYASAFNPRPAYDHSAETTIYLAQNARGRGCGKTLYQALFAELKKQGVINLEACIGVPAAGDKSDNFINTNSADFHAHLGFRLVGRFEKCGYKGGRWLDMVWMEKRIADQEEAPHFIPYPILKKH